MADKSSRIEDLKPFTCRRLPAELAPLTELALDVRWTWNHAMDHLWRTVEPQTWDTTRNPWWMLQSISQEKLEHTIHNLEFLRELDRLIKTRSEFTRKRGWYRENFRAGHLKAVAYFSMEFGLGEAIPLYAGGLGILAGDYLKTASDLNMPLVGVGLLYQQGYFRQLLDVDGSQISANPPNDPICLPIRPVTDSQGGWLRVPIELPGRTLLLRAWKVQVGRITLYLLDSNDPMNDPSDRSIAYRLYEDQPEFRLIQEMILGMGGWRLLEMLGIHPDVCHLNEGHTAFAVLERARSFAKTAGQSFPIALWATRAGNVFTTHTAVSAGFDLFPADLVSRYFREYADSLAITMEQVLALGRQNPEDGSEPFNMATLAMRGSSAVNGVSLLHERVSRQLFQMLFPRWPQHEVPVSHITNGVHMPSWDSKEADRLWTKTGGRECWCHDTGGLESDMLNLTDEEIWSLRAIQRREFVSYVRRRMESHYQRYCMDHSLLGDVPNLLDPDILTVGFARRFAAYKRPNLVLHDRARLVRILTRPDRPVQVVIAGKAHPKDVEGKRLVQELVQFSRQPEIRPRIVFLPDYDIELAQEMVKGIDLWLSTPRRPWEACGTSGMKVLVNGGLNVSELDGWWAEAYKPELGWALGDGREHDTRWDAAEADQLYNLLENEITAAFYERDGRGVPAAWVKRIRASMCCLSPQFSSNRMVREYIVNVYHPSAARWRARKAGKADLARRLNEWQRSVREAWPGVRFGTSRMEQRETQWTVECEVHPGKLSPEAIAVEVFADPPEGDRCFRQAADMVEKLPSAEPCYLYRASFPTGRPASDYSLRIIPAHPAAVIPLEENHVLWKYPI